MSAKPPPPEPPALLHHGGRLRAAASDYAIALDEWLDLSTGINPNGWKVPPVPPSHWARLPEDNDGLEAAARGYYESEHALPVAGSQAAIQALPRLRTKSRVVVLEPGYAEHVAAWRRAGHRVTVATADKLSDFVPRSDVLVLSHPNNPTGARFAQTQLLDWRARLAARGGWLVIDEAFMDITREESLCRFAMRPGLIVLRSLGKFFGLAGARVGFVCAQPGLLARLRALLGPWSISAPARWVATAALRDFKWQARARANLTRDGVRLYALLARYRLAPDGGCALFQWRRTSRAAALHESLARRGILTRLYSRPPSLRFGLPGSESAWERLEAALQNNPAQSPRSVRAGPW